MKTKASPIASTQAQTAIRKLCTRIVGFAPMYSERRNGARRFKWHSYSDDKFSVKNVNDMYQKFCDLLIRAAPVGQIHCAISNAEYGSRISQCRGRGISITVKDTCPNVRLTIDEVKTLAPTPDFVNTLTVILDSGASINYASKTKLVPFSKMEKVMRELGFVAK